MTASCQAWFAARSDMPLTAKHNSGSMTQPISTPPLLEVGVLSVLEY